MLSTISDEGDELRLYCVDHGDLFLRGPLPVKMSFSVGRDP